MAASIEMKSAIAEFDKIRSSDCTIDYKIDKPIYTLVKIAGWPSVIHYEFRYSEAAGLFVELHAERKDFSWIGEVYRRCSEETPHIDGRRVEYFKNQPYPNYKEWPSLSIALGAGVLGTTSAQVMLKFINATRPTITRALGNWTASAR